MNKNLRTTLIIINGLIFFLSIRWFLRDMDYEPGIAVCSQAIGLLCIIFDKQAANILTANTTNNSKIKIRGKSGDSITTQDTDNSEIDIDTR